MTNLVKADLLPFTIPSGGMSTAYPLTKTPLEYSPWIQDFDNEGGFYETRKGVKFAFNADNNYISAIAAHPTNRNRLVIIDTSLNANNLMYYDILTQTTGHIGSSAGLAAYPRALTASFNKNVFFFITAAAPRQYNGTTYGATTFTGPSMISMGFGFSYKSRMYFVTKGTGSVWYGDIGATGGAMTEVDFSSLTTDSGSIVCGFSFTLSSGTNSDALFALVFDTGELLVFSGNYPNDLTTWQLVSRARIGSPLSYQSIVEINGDILVLTKNGIVSCRTLLTTAQGDIQAATITTQIEKYWSQLVTQIINESPASVAYDTGRLSFINASFHQLRNKLLVFLPRYLIPYGVNLTGYAYVMANAVLVYDIPTKAWTIHVPNLQASGQYISSYYWPTYGKLYFGTNDTSLESCWEYWGRDDYRDEKTLGSFNAFNPALITSLASMQYNSIVKGVFVTHEGEFCKNNATMQLIGDCGAIYSLPQGGQFGVDGNVSRDYYNVGLASQNIAVRVDMQTDVSGSMSRPYRFIDLTLQIEVTRSPK